MGRVEGEVIIVTGAASGIGRATAERLAEEGAMVTVADVKPSGAEVSSGINDRGGKAIFVETDVTRESDCENLVRMTVGAFGKLDGLVNNAGMANPAKIHETTLKNWRETIDVNLTSVYFCSKFAIPEMLKQKRGAIINISSLSGVAADFGMAAYNAAKGGVTNLTRNMALDYVADGIRVNAICPGTILTPMFEDRLDEIGYEQGMRKWVEAYPTGWIGAPRDIANAVLFLISDEARFINGVNLLVDGGITAHTGQPRFGRGT